MQDGQTLDVTPVADLPPSAAPVLITRLRNEVARLPRWIAHYRQLGIERFVVIDNGSTDETPAWLAAQPDVVALRTTQSYREANGGMDWINAVRDALPADAWTLYVDADEYLVYDGPAGRSVTDYLAAVPDRCNAVLAFMLDMYPKGEVAEVAAGDDLLGQARFFDRDYVFRRRPVKPWQKATPSIEFIGGPRARLFSSLERERRTTWVSYFLRGQIDRLLQVTPARWRRTLIENFPMTLPALKKTPFLRGRETRYANSHDARGCRYHARNCVLLHYKFTADFAGTVEREIDRGQYYRFGAEYILYKKHILGRGPLTLYSPQASAEFRSADDLVAAGLIREVTPYVA